MINAFSITELSTLTGKSRPSLYKYISAYEKKNFDDLPYSFIKLFELMEKADITRKEIMEYCDITFKKIDSDLKVNELINLIRTYKDKLDLDQLKQYIYKELTKNE